MGAAGGSMAAPGKAALLGQAGGSLGYTPAVTQAVAPMATFITPQRFPTPACSTREKDVMVKGPVSGEIKSKSAPSVRPSSTATSMFFSHPETGPILEGGTR